MNKNEVYIEGKCFEEDCKHVWFNHKSHYCYLTEKDITIENKKEIDNCNNCNKE